MNISPVNMYSYNPVFKSYREGYEYDEEFGIYVKKNEDFYLDNSFGQNLRDYMRNSMYERAGLEIKHQSTEAANSIEDVFIPNFKKLANGSYRGASLKDFPAYVELLARSGVETVVDLHGFIALAKACHENNLNYVKMDMRNDFWTNPMCKTNKELIDKKRVFLNYLGLTSKEYEQELINYESQIDEERRAFMQKIIDAIKVMNDGKFYIGCELGDYRTSNFLALNYYFNPKWGSEKIETEPYITDKCRNIYDNMTQDEKDQLGITESYEAIVEERLGY